MTTDFRKIVEQAKREQEAEKAAAKRKAKLIRKGANNSAEPGALDLSQLEDDEDRRS
jgi:hypothetical protein